MTLQFQTIQYHRNGISGAPFHAVLFRDPDEGNMLGVVFEEPYHVAVFNLNKLAMGNITFGVNSWRGDVYEPILRRAIANLTAAENLNREHEEPPTDPTGSDCSLVPNRKDSAMKSYRVHVLAHVVEQYEIQAANRHEAEELWCEGRFLRSDDSSSDSLVLRVEEL